MTRALTPVPATLPGVVRRGTPVTLTGEDVVRTLRGRACTVHAVHEGMASVVVDGVDVVVIADLSALTVDLTDATGRDHGLRALAAHSCRAAPGVWWLPLDDGRWSLRCEPRRGFVTFRAPGAPELSESRPEVPSLADIDPNDPTLLPDGSRWVDAEALARVLVHVLGGAS